MSEGLYKEFVWDLKIACKVWNFGSGSSLVPKQGCENPRSGDLDDCVGSNHQKIKITDFLFFPRFLCFHAHAVVVNDFYYSISFSQLN